MFFLHTFRTPCQMNAYLYERTNETNSFIRFCHKKGWVQPPTFQERGKTYRIITLNVYYFVCLNKYISKYCQTTMKHEKSMKKWSMNTKPIKLKCWLELVFFLWIKTNVCWRDMIWNEWAATIIVTQLLLIFSTIRMSTPNIPA